MRLAFSQSVVVAIAGFVVTFCLTSLTLVDDEISGIPIYRHPDMPILNRVIEYAFPFIAPVASTIECPLHGQDATACLAPVRSKIDAMNELQYTPLLVDYTETVVIVPAAGYNDPGPKGPPVNIILLRPREHDVKKEALPLVLWVHGGGMVMSNAREGYMAATIIQGMDARLKQKGVMWASVEYRLAPEAPWPAAPEDCLRALRYLIQHKQELGIDIDGSNLDSRSRRNSGGVHLAGVSAGGNLAITTCFAALKEGLPVLSLFVDQPMLPFLPPKRHTNQPSELQSNKSPQQYSPSWIRNSYTRIVPTAWLEWCWRAYLRDRCTAEERQPFDEQQKSPQPDSDVLSCDTDPASLSLDPSTWVQAMQSFNASIRLRAFAENAVYPPALQHSSRIKHDKSSVHIQLPPAVVLTALGDPLRDAGAAFANAYRRAGGLVHHTEARGSHVLPLLVDAAKAGKALDAWAAFF